MFLKILIENLSDEGALLVFLFFNLGEMNSYMYLKLIKKLLFYWTHSRGRLKNSKHVLRHVAT